MLINLNYINQKDKELTKLFISCSTSKKYILGINKLTKSVLKHIEVDGIIDDFTRIQSSRKKKNILQIEDVSKDAIILSTSSGSPLEVKIKLDEMGYNNFNYLSFYKYSGLDLADPPFITDFKDDYKINKSRYLKIYDLLEDEKSKEIFTKVINFKISFDLDFMEGFINNFDEQYFDKDLIPQSFKDKNIVFLDGGGYIGDTLPNIMNNFLNFKKIYCVEPSQLHIKIAKENFDHIKNIEFINCGLGDKKVVIDEKDNHAIIVTITIKLKIQILLII